MIKRLKIEGPRKALILNFPVSLKYILDLKNDEKTAFPNHSSTSNQQVFKCVSDTVLSNRDTKKGKNQFQLSKNSCLMKVYNMQTVKYKQEIQINWR